MRVDSKVLLGLLAGAAVGAIAGILFAPDKGSETRKKIRQNTADLGDQLKDSFNDFVDTVKDKYQNAREDVEDAVEKGKSAILSRAAKNS
ncbi:MAG: YtxH domain-containing protein [Chitinophagaceae bacterium]|nr:YtxH domain-containing protein [Chitinophagaceae bacterium]